MAVLLAFSALGTNVNATGVPSNWAVAEVEAAMAGGLVPQELRDGFKETITRAEYVLLALEILEDAGIDVPIVFNYPFEDIRGHVYEKQLVKAYNTKLIDGYDDQSFKPDKLINREEIATLIVNLVKVLEPGEVIGGSEEYTYSDESKISGWARVYVDYCYANQIIKGIGKDALLIDIIDPLGNTTIEQAIVLIYRLAVEKDIYSELTYKTGDVLIKYSDGTTEDVSERYNDYENVVGKEVAKDLYELQQLSYFNFNDIAEGYAEVVHKDGSELSYNIGVITEIRLELRDLDNLVVRNAYIDFVEDYDPTIVPEVTIILNEAIIKLENSIDYTSETQLSTGIDFYIFANEIVPYDGPSVETIYIFQLLER